MKNLKIVNQEELKDWAKEIFQKNSFNMVDAVSYTHLTLPTTPYV